MVVQGNCSALLWMEINVAVFVLNKCMLSRVCAYQLFCFTSFTDGALHAVIKCAGLGKSLKSTFKLSVN